MSTIKNNRINNRSSNKQHQNRTLNVVNKQVTKKPVESTQSQIFKMKRTFIRTFKALDLMMKQNFDTNIMEVVNTFDEPAKDELLSKNINELFSTIDTELGSIIQPAKPSIDLPLIRNREQANIIQELKTTIKNLNRELAEKAENDLLDAGMATEETE